jgi:Rad3-related DNA helicase
MLSSALATKKKVLFGSCNSSVQNSIVDEVLTLNMHKKHLKVAALIGKSHFCPQFTEFYYEACDFARKEKDCPYYENCYNYNDGKKKSQRMRKALDLINKTVIESPESLKGKSFVKFVREIAEKEGVCPYEAMISLAEEADVVVLDYFYLFSNIFTFAKNRILKDPGNYVLLIDEADEIKERLLSGILTRQTTSFSLHTLKEQVKKMQY